MCAHCLTIQVPIARGDQSLAVDPRLGARGTLGALRACPPKAAGPHWGPLWQARGGFSELRNPNQPFRAAFWLLPPSSREPRRAKAGRQSILLRGAPGLRRGAFLLRFVLLSLRAADSQGLDRYAALETELDTTVDTREHEHGLQERGPARESNNNLVHAEPTAAQPELSVPLATSRFPLEARLVQKLSCTVIDVLEAVGAQLNAPIPPANPQTVAN
jgi:hypothetical protein